jgi:hypothetical protein
MISFLWRCYMIRLVVLSLLALLCFGIASQMSQAALIAHDDFESYTAGTDLAGGTGGTGWTAAWAADGTNPAPSGTVTVQSGVIAGAGQSMQLNGGGLPDLQIRNLVNRSFAAQSGTMYIGYLLKASSWETDDFFTIYTNNNGTASTDVGGEAGITTAPSNYFTRKGGSGTQRATGVPFVNDATVQMVLKLTKSPQAPPGDYDQVELFINKLSEGVPDAIRTSAQTPLAGNVNLEDTLSFVHFRLSTPEVGDLIYVDELRVADSYGDALSIPEPATASLLFAMAMLGSVTARRSRVCQM